MVLETSLKKMEQSLQVNGSKTVKSTELKFCRMALLIQVISRNLSIMDTENVSGQKVISIKETGTKVTWKDLENTPGQMVLGILVIGKKISSVVPENTIIQVTREYIKENISMTKNMAKESLNGRMGKSLLETSKMAFNMEKVYFI